MENILTCLFAFDQRIDQHGIVILIEVADNRIESRFALGSDIQSDGYKGVELYR